jgi:hypothetical protein
MAKIKQSETVFLKRSLINFAAYNPRKKNPKVVEALKKNFKKVGFLGGIQFNKTTSNLIGGHKRLEALDLCHNYDGTAETDYDVKVEQIEIDLKTEKEQNIFLNNKRVQGEMDMELMAELISEIDIENAALEEYDIEMIETLVPNFKMGDNSLFKIDSEILKERTEEEKAITKAGRKETKNATTESRLSTHFTVTFKTYDEKAEFLENIGINGDDVYITSDKFLKRLNG